jgi:hypothetical protein
VVRRRIAAQHLAASDWPLFDALVAQQVWRAEGREARMFAKVAASAAASQSTSELPPAPNASDATTASPASGSSSSDAKATSSDEAASPAAESVSEGDGNKAEPEPGDDRNPRKGHGRNGASAFRAAQHYFYALALGVIGAVCTACQLGKMSRYRELLFRQA